MATKPLQAGVLAPDFELPSAGGKSMRLKDLLGKTLVLYFYPKASTPGCTKQACGFRDAVADYKKAGLTVIGISPDKVTAVDKFVAKYTLNFPLLADADHAVCQSYGVWQQKSMMGRKYMGVVRTTFIIDKNGRIAHVFENVKPVGHDQQVLDWVKEQAE